MENTNKRKAAQQRKNMEQAVLLTQKGLNIAQISRVMGVASTTVKRWLSDADCTPTTRGSLKKERIEQALALHQQGQSGAQIARHMGVTKSTVYTWLSSMGCKSTNAPSRAEQKRAHMEQAVALCQEGMTPTQVAQNMGVTTHSVYQWLRDAGYKSERTQAVSWGCPLCGKHTGQIKNGKSAAGVQRYICRDCKRAYEPENTSEAGVPHRIAQHFQRVAQAVALHRQGKTGTQIAQQMGASPATVYKWLEAAGYKSQKGKDHGQTCPFCGETTRQVKNGRKRDGTQTYLCRHCQKGYANEQSNERNKAEVAITAAQEQAFVARQQGVPVPQIAKNMGLSVSTIYKWLELCNKKNQGGLVFLGDDACEWALAQLTKGEKPSRIARACGVPTTQVYEWRNQAKQTKRAREKKHPQTPPQARRRYNKKSPGLPFARPEPQEPLTLPKIEDDAGLRQWAVQAYNQGHRTHDIALACGKATATIYTWLYRNRHALNHPDA